MFKTTRLTFAVLVGALALPLVGSTSAMAATTPKCIVSLSPSATETLYAIGAGHQVQAVDKDANYPTAGLPTKRVDALNPSVEAIIGICKKTASHPSTKPDLVVISYDANSIKAKLAAVGVRVVEMDAPTTTAGALGQIVRLGQLTGHSATASRLARSLDRAMKSLVHSIPAHPGKVLTAYYELDTTYYSLTSRTFVGSLLKSLGVVNVADAKSTSADAGYPQLSAEYVVSANPKLIFLADSICCKASAASLAKRPGFSKVAAVKDGEVIALNDDVASRWGPRLVLLLQEMTVAVKGSLHNAKLWQ
jgi:iron complex transport system substrate-binding protein